MVSAADFCWLNEWMGTLRTSLATQCCWHRSYKNVLKRRTTEEENIDPEKRGNLSWHLVMYGWMICSQRLRRWHWLLLLQMKRNMLENISLPCTSLTLSPTLPHSLSLSPSLSLPRWRNSWALDKCAVYSQYLNRLYFFVFSHSIAIVFPILKPVRPIGLAGAEG